MGKGEIACYEQFLLFPQCFQKACFLEASKGVIVWEWVKQLRSYHGGRWRTRVSWLSHTSTNTTFLSKATDYFSHMLLLRWEAKICRKEKSSQPGIELTTTRSWVRHAHHWATQAGQTLWKKEKLLVTSNFSFSHSVFYGLALLTLKN